MRLSDERLKEMIGAGVPCVPANEAEAAAMAREVMEAREAINRLVNAKALAGVRDVVAGWNGENRPEGPYNERHPNNLGATLPKTTCGAIYELDDAMQSARNFIKDKETDNAGE